MASMLAALPAAAEAGVGAGAVGAVGNSSSGGPSGSNVAPHAQHQDNANFRQNNTSSKLPAFRFADLKEQLALPLPALLQQNIQNIPPSPVSPNNLEPTLDTERPPAEPTQPTPPDSTTATSGNRLSDVQDGQTNPASAHNSEPKPDRLPASSSITTTSPSSRHQALDPPVPAPSTTQTPSSTKRPASYPDSPVQVTRLHRTLSSASARPQQRRATGSFTSSGLETTHGPPPSLNKKRLHAVQAVQGEQIADSTTKDWAQGQRELLLPKSLDKGGADDKRKPTSRPPVSFRRPKHDGVSPRAVIPPIRAFRSSGSRKSLVLDMNLRSPHQYDDGDDISDPNHRDRTLRALEGRGSEDDYLQMTPPDSAGAMPEDENTADLFMHLAHEDAMRRPPEQDRPVEEQNTVSRIVRTTTRRPFSAAIPSYQATSPPQLTRRLSDQRENARLQRYGDDQSAQQMTRDYRTASKERPSPAQQLGTPRSRALGPARPSPNTPRSTAFQDFSSEVGSVSSRRRGSLGDASSGLLGRNPSYNKASYGLPKNYNSSPLAQRNGVPQGHDYHEQSLGPEGTESTASTAAPSTVWDELDELKSRMRRLELTGKIPSTSGAAMSRVSDDRPPTATTNATTVSGSPKRTSGNGQAEASSTTSSQRETQPMLLSALSKAKSHISAEVYGAIESAAGDALALSQMVGVAGQPGPISSGASTIGIGGTATVTDRQLRRKADSICRNLTELCLALNEEANQTKTVQISTPREEKYAPLTSPTAMKGFSALAATRRPSAIADSGLMKINTSPRAATRLEDRRTTFLNSPALQTPRYAASPNTPTDSIARKSSLMVSRTRRAGTEEPEDSITRKSSLLRTRRAGTEEPDEGRKTSLLLRTRAAANEEDDEESRYRAPSRAVTEVAGLRAGPRDYQPQGRVPDGGALASSALPRRRLEPSSLNSRLVAPSTPGSLSGRRFLDRSTPDRESNNVAEKLAEDRGQRPLSLGQTAMLNRTGSLNRRNRDSGIPSLSTASQMGGYR